MTAHVFWLSEIHFPVTRGSSRPLLICGKPIEVFKAWSDGFEPVVRCPLIPDAEMRTHGSQRVLQPVSNRGRHVKGIPLIPCRQRPRLRSWKKEHREGKARAGQSLRKKARQKRWAGAAARGQEGGPQLNETPQSTALAAQKLSFWRQRCLSERLAKRPAGHSPTPTSSKGCCCSAKKPMPGNSSPLSKTPYLRAVRAR